MITIALCGSPTWAEAAADAVRTAGASPSIHADLSGYIARLADQYTALIVVEGESPGWSAWVAAAKTSPATRRIPVVVVTADAAQAESAIQNGADRVVTPDALPGVIGTLARTPPSEAASALAAQCADPLPPQAIEAIERFNAGAYYAQHDLFEALWMDDPRPVRDLYRAILQVGIAYYQIERGNGRGALKMLLRSVQWLALLPDVCQGVDIAGLRADAAAVRAELERVGDDLAAFDRSLLKPVRRV
ncbi:MAG: DUF309 domain-containing protein [bacterium]|nr:DUF309 domain-containing protein [bacterium]